MSSLVGVCIDMPSVQCMLGFISAFELNLHIKSKFNEKTGK